MVYLGSSSSAVAIIYLERKGVLLRCFSSVSKEEKCIAHHAGKKGSDAGVRVWVCDGVGLER
jgi:hypothetical protein